MEEGLERELLDQIGDLEIDKSILELQNLRLERENDKLRDKLQRAARDIESLEQSVNRDICGLYYSGPSLFGIDIGERI